jgi:hypothetical protein
MKNPIRPSYFTRLRQSFGKPPILTEEDMRAAIARGTAAGYWDDLLASEITISYVSEPDATGFPI